MASPYERQGASPRYFDEILALIRGGMTGAEACASKPEYPGYRSLTEWAAKHGRKEEISAAWREREESRTTARMKTNLRYTEQQWTEVLELLVANPQATERRFFATICPRHLPPRHAVNARRKSDPIFAKRYREAQLRRPAVIPRGPNYNVIARGRQAYIRKQTFPSGMLKRALQANMLFVTADQAVSSNLPDDARDDVISTLIERVLSGRIEIAEIPACSRGVIHEWFKTNSSPYQRSLDQRVFGEDGEDSTAFVDTITTCEMTGW